MTMSIMEKRILLFLFGCIGTRSLIAFLAKIINPQYLPIMGVIALLPAIGFSYLFITGGRNTGPEVFGEKIWWNVLRPVHALLYFAFAFAAISKKNWSWLILLLDVIIGLMAFVLYHYFRGDFSY
jgi:hypothetical protein